MQLFNASAPSPRRVRVFLAEKGIDVPTTTLQILDGEARTPAFLAKNSLGGTPVLELDDGRILTESVAICRYFEELHPEPPLFGNDAYDRGLVEMWNRRMEIEILNRAGAIAQHTFPFFAQLITQVPALADAQRIDLARALEWLNQEMSDGRPFVAGSRFTVADITGIAACTIMGFLEIQPDSSLTHYLRWEERIRGRPSWAA